MRESSGVAPGLADLPAGGAAISPLGGRFEPDLVRGSGSYAIPFDCPRGPNELRPSLSLVYGTGAGAGPFGLGWRLNLLKIERQSDRGVPTYTDVDAFVLGDAEVLVAMGDGSYRPQTDHRRWFIERQGDGWRVRTGDGRTLFFGQTAEAREEDGARTFAWLLEEERDAAGNSIRYAYRRDGNRLYLEEVRYSIFRVRVLYEARPDLMRHCRAGFERRLALRARAVTIHSDRPDPLLLRTYSFAYDASNNGASLLERVTLSATDGEETARFPEPRFGYSSLDLAAWEVHELKAAIAPPALDDPLAQLVDMTGDGLPDVLQSAGVRMLLWRNRGDGFLEGPEAVDGVPATVSLEREAVAFADLDGNGRVDLFAVDQPLAAAFRANGRGGFEPEPTLFRDRPSLRLAAGDTRLMDLDGDGVTDLIATGPDHLLLSRHAPGVGWEPVEAVSRVGDLEVFPDVAFGDRGVRLADMTGDGLQDFVVARSGDVAYWPYLGHGRWGARVELGHAPRLPDGYREERLHLVDLDGDGCADLVYFDHDRTLLWLNRGGQSFSPPVELPVAPPPGAHILAADLFGDGRPGFAWSAPATTAESAGYRFLRLDSGRAPSLMVMVDNGMGGRFEMEYAATTAMRLADREEGRDWTGELPLTVQVLRTLRERDTISGRQTDLSIRYHDGVYDGPRREFRGFRQVTVELDGDESTPAVRQEYTFFQGDPEHPDLLERDRQRALAGAPIHRRIFAGGLPRRETVHTWETRQDHAGPGRTIFFPFIAAVETREFDPGDGPTRVERSETPDYDFFGNLLLRRSSWSFAGEAPENALRLEERFTYTGNEADWLVRLPVRRELRDREGVPLSIEIRHYDGPPFLGLPEGQATAGLVTRVENLALLQARLPPDYVGDRDLRPLGYVLAGAGDTRGFYATTFSVRRDGQGNVVERRDPLENPTTLAHDADGVFPIRATDARGMTTEFTFDRRAGEPARIVAGNGRFLRAECDPLGRLVAHYERDDAGEEQLVQCWRLNLTTLPVSVTAAEVRGAGHDRVQFGAGADLAGFPDVGITRVYYDGFGKIALQVATGADGPGGARRFVATRRLRLNPRLKASVEFPPVFVPDLGFTPPPAPGPDCIHYRYDEEGNVESVAGPGPVRRRTVRGTQLVRHWEAEAAGDPEDAEPPGPPARLERYDARGRVIRIEDAVGDGTTVVTAYQITDDGRLAAVLDEAGREVVRYVFAGPGEPVRIVHRDLGARTYYRDALGRIAELVMVDGGRLFYTYDTAGRPTRVEHTPPGGARRILREYSYDADPERPATPFLDGRLAVVREPEVVLRYGYDRAGRMVHQEAEAGGAPLAIDRLYNLQGELVALTYPDGRRLEYVRDASGAVAGIPGVLSGLLYGADGALEGYTLANGVAVTLPRDPSTQRLSEVAAHRGPDLLRRLRYGYDAVGNVTSLVDETPGGSEQHDFTLDGLHRLTGFTVRAGGPAGALLREGSYRYQAEGNLLEASDTLPLRYEYGDPGRPGRLTRVTVGAAAEIAAYDARGHLAALGDLEGLEFDPLDRLTRVRRTGGTEVRLRYDPQGRRVLKEIEQAGATRAVRYVADVYERHADHRIRHVYLDQWLVADEVAPDAGAVRLVGYLVDHHGTLLLATDGAGAILQNQRYSPFGAALDRGISLDRYLGHERDVETGLLHLGARHYAPSLGRFVSPDWYVFENPDRPARMPQGFNLYAYALNNPLVFKDPSGRWFFAIPFIVGFVAGAVYGIADGRSAIDVWNIASETALTTGFGTVLGWGVGMAVGGPVLGAIGGLMGGLNGLLTGTRSIYEFGRIEGWVSFLSDSTWGLLGTSVGNVVNIYNLMAAPSSYRSDLSKRQNRQVYESGFYLDKAFAFTQGAVISNLNGNEGTILKHETVHIMQNRIFGVYYYGVSIVWAVGGGIVGGIVGIFADQNWFKSIRDMAYTNSPWEQWAYAIQGSDVDKGKLAW